MQTFLPYADFRESAAVLDQKRLGKQRVETLQIMTALLEGRGWTNHPATRMWAGYERALFEYQKAICREWTDIRGYQDSCLEKTFEIYYQGTPVFQRGLKLPPWLGVEAFHEAHRSMLIQKKPEHYAPLFVGTPHDLPYLWPVVERGN